MKVYLMMLSSFSMTTWLHQYLLHFMSFQVPDCGPPSKEARRYAEIMAWLDSGKETIWGYIRMWSRGNYKQMLYSRTSSKCGRWYNKAMVNQLHRSPPIAHLYVFFFCNYDHHSTNERIWTRKFLSRHGDGRRLWASSESSNESLHVNIFLLVFLVIYTTCTIILSMGVSQPEACRARNKLCQWSFEMYQS